MDDVPEPYCGGWYQVISGIHRKKEGVCDNIRDFPTGRRYRLGHPHLKEPVGWFAAEQLAEINAPAYVPKASQDAQSEALRRMMTPNE